MVSTDARYRKVLALLAALACAACTGHVSGLKEAEKGRADAKGGDGEVIDAPDGPRPSVDSGVNGSASGDDNSPGSSFAPADSGIVLDAGAGDAGANNAGADDVGAGDAGELSKTPTVDRSDPQLRTFSFEPKDLDPLADEWLDTEYAYIDTRVPPAGRLVVYLVGADGKPKNGEAMMQYIAAQGFHVLAPAYANDYGISKDCASDDADCKANKRLEAFDGVDRSPHIVVKPADSIETRVVALLREVDKQHAGGDWSFFLSGDQPRWNAIVVMGHSHGASTAAIIGKVRKLERAISLSGPFDNNNNLPDAWLSWPPKTRADRFYGFSHTLEEQHSGHLAAWAAMGLNEWGAPADVGLLSAPYNQSHQLITGRAVDNFHGSTAAGGSSPKLRNGSYVFAPVWRQMLAP